MATLDIARLSLTERLDLIGELLDGLAAEGAKLTAAQQTELSRRIDRYELAHDDLAWAKPYIDEALAETERGDVVTPEEAQAHLDARFGRLAD